MASVTESLEAVKYASFYHLRQKHDELAADHEALKVAHNRLIAAHNDLVEVVTELQRLFGRIQTTAAPGDKP